MIDGERISVAEAARRLGVGEAAVRHHIAARQLPAVKRGPVWWLERQAVERMARDRPGAGRPLSPRMCWAVLLLASADPEGAAQIAGRDRYMSRARAWLRDHPLAEHAARLRSRAVREDFDAHPAELRRLLERPDVSRTGLSAAGLVGIHGGPAVLEVYAPEGRRHGIVEDHALDPGPGALRVRWVRDELWAVMRRAGADQAPRAAVLVDLLESDDPRARREASRALAR